MIDVKELRIGNWYRLEEGKDYILSLDNWLDILASYRNNEFLKGTNIEWMSGVLITPEWLERFGFEKDAFGTLRSPLDISTPTLAYDTRTNSIGYELYRGAVDWFKHIKYIHQLQNLYFALTGEELKYTL